MLCEVVEDVPKQAHFFTYSNGKGRLGRLRSCNLCQALQSTMPIGCSRHKKHMTQASWDSLVHPVPHPIPAATSPGRGQIPMATSATSYCKSSTPPELSKVLLKVRSWPRPWPLYKLHAVVTQAHALYCPTVSVQKICLLCCFDTVCWYLDWPGMQSQRYAKMLTVMKRCSALEESLEWWRPGRDGGGQREWMPERDGGDYRGIGEARERRWRPAWSPALQASPLAVLTAIQAQSMNNVDAEQEGSHLQSHEGRSGCPKPHSKESSMYMKG